MTYSFRETPDTIIVKRGIATREMTKVYDHGREYTPYEELELAARRTPTVPISVDNLQQHGLPLRMGRRVVGTVYLKPCPDRRGLQGEWHFRKESCPEWLITAIRRGETLPVSPFFYSDVQDGIQRDILFNRFAVMEEGTPRCPPDRCGVGVADAMTPEKDEVEMKGSDPKIKPGLTVTKPEGTGVPDPVPPEQSGKLSETESTVEGEVQTGQDPAQTVKELTERLKEAEAESEKARSALKQERLPLEGLLAQRGVSAEAIAAMNMKDLRTMVAAVQRSTTEGLPLASPAPAPKPAQTPEEAHADRWGKFQKDLDKRSKDEFSGM